MQQLPDRCGHARMTQIPPGLRSMFTTTLLRHAKKINGRIYNNVADLKVNLFEHHYGCLQQPQVILLSLFTRVDLNS